MSIRLLGERPLPVPPPSRREAVEAAGPKAPAPGPEAGAGAPFSRVLRAIAEEAARGERQVLEAARASQSGRDLGGAELLVLQAGIYRYSEVVDLGAKLADRATNAVKTVLSGQ